MTFVYDDGIVGRDFVPISSEVFFGYNREINHDGELICINLPSSIFSLLFRTNDKSTSLREFESCSGFRRTCSEKQTTLLLVLGEYSNLMVI